ncbi:hypothetical protein DFH07DRAFT_823436 [Mycena maculata]|uniref:Uncharacterized protein n=1 Tax=Mycena maculata TaxID=230809 RepID=A0AAD7J0K9_9AGAR|nr:hypothetical protein DFH07DRAFT_823436 [Mycena maculata]
MASSPDHRLTSSPFASSTRQFSNEPVTPLQGGPDTRMAGEFGPGNDSPTSTLSESASFRFNDSTSRSAFRATFTPASGTPSRKTLMRSDPSILTTFDPADRELYDLWAPKN